MRKVTINFVYEWAKYPIHIILFLFLLIFLSSFADLTEKTKSIPEKSTFFSQSIYQLKQSIVKDFNLLIKENQLPNKNYFVKDKKREIKNIKQTYTFPNALAPSDCPDIDIIDLRNVAGFPQIDDLTKCGAADTLSLIIFTGDPGEVKGFEFTVDLPDGLEYAGWEYTQLGNTSISLSKNKLHKPEFLVTGITGDSLVIVNIGIRATCEVDKTESLFFDFAYEYTFIDTLNNVHQCDGVFQPNLEYNSSVHEPVINVLSPLTPTGATILTVGEPACQEIQISQDGLNAYLDSFTFEIIGIDFNAGEFILDSITANGIVIPLSAVNYNAATLTAAFLVDGSYFPSNNLANGAPERMNTNEILTLEICYKINQCPNIIDLPFKYNAYFGCDEVICQESGQNSFISVRPTGEMPPNATVSLNTGGIEICGTPGNVSLTLSNPNPDTEQFVYNNLSIGFQTCDKPNLEVTGVTVGGVPIPSSFYEWVGDDINIDFSENTDATIGLEDYDDDNFYDDLRGGQSISVVVEIGVTCGIDGSDGDCANINCKNIQFYVEALTNCGNRFKDFPTPDTFNLVYGATSVSNPTESEIASTGVQGYNFGTYSDNTDTISTDSSALEITFCYSFEKENIDDCPTEGTNYFQVNLKGDPRFAKDVEFVPGTDSISTDSGLTYTLVNDVTFTRPDDNNAILKINAGSNALNVCYKYTLEMDTCLCSPVGYFTGQQKVVSVCPDCEGGCEILKACRDVTFKADPNCKDCDCIIRTTNVRTERTNFGYKDKTMTERHTRRSLIDSGGSVDLSRFVPGDTLIHKNDFVIVDQLALDNLIRWNLYWSFFDNETTSNSAVANLELTMDAHGASLEKFQVTKAGGSLVDINLTALSECITDNVSAYGGVWNYFENTPWGDSIDNIESHNSSSDMMDNNRLTISFWNYDKIETCGGTAANQGGGDCLDQIISTYNIEVGDTLHFTFKAPLIKNPHRAALEAKGLAPPATNIARIYHSFNVYELEPIGGSSTYCYTLVGGTCQEFQPIYLDCPGDIDVVTKMDLTDCGGTVTHEFTVNDFAGPIGDPWFTHEYRPLMNIYDVDALIRAPLAYCANAQVEKLGMVYDVQVDSTMNMFCNPVDGYDENLCAVDTGSLGKVVFNLTNQDVPAMGIGLDNCDTLRLSYDLCMICPADIEGVLEYNLVYDWAYTGIQHVRETRIHNQYRCNFSTNLDNTICDEYGFASSEYYWETLDFDTLTYKKDQESAVFILNDMRDPLDPVSVTNKGANLLASDSPGVSEEIQRIQICNTDTDDLATGVGASVTVPSSVRFVNVYSDTTGTPISLSATLISDDGEDKVYAITLPANTLAPGECDTIYVGTTLLYCPEPGALPPNICVGTFSGCAPDDVKAALAASGGCSGSEVCYTYIFGEIDVQTEWFDLPANPTLCDTVIFNVRVKNVKQLVLLDLEPTFELPVGITPVPGSWEVSYPGGEVAPLNWVSIGTNPDIVNGNSYAYSDDALWSTIINSNGLQGISLANATLDSNKVAFRFKAISSCDKFLSGSKLITETTAANPCSDSRITSGFTESPGVIINGADPIDYAQLLLISDPEVINCEGTINTFGITAINSGTKSTSDSVLMCLTLPAALTYTDGSIVFTNPSGFIPDSVIQTAIGDKLEVCFNAPPIGAYGSFSLNFDAAMDKDAACGNIRIGTDIKSFVDMVTCNPGPPIECGVFVQNSLNNFINVELNPPFIPEELVVLSDCSNDPDSVKLFYEFVINHNGPDAVNQDYTVNFYEDIDDDQSVNPNIDGLLATTGDRFSVTDGATITLSGEVTVNADQSCPILFEVVYDTDCACDRISKFYNQIQFKNLRDYQEPITMCAGSCFDIEICDFVNINADSVDGATGVAYIPVLDWDAANRYTYPRSTNESGELILGPAAAFITYEDLTDNSIGNGDNNLLLAEQNSGYGDAHIVAIFDKPVNVSSIFLGGGQVSGWSGSIHGSYGGSLTLMKLEYSDDGDNWINSETVFYIPGTAVIEETVLSTPISAQYWRISSNSTNDNWAASEFRLEGPPVAYQGFTPVSQSGNTVTVCIPPDAGIDAAWPVKFSTGTGTCLVTETIEIWQSGVPPFTIEGDTTVCGSECFEIEVIIPNEATQGMTIQWTPANLVDDPTAFSVDACNLTGDVTFEATITYNNGDCQEVLQWPVNHYPINSIAIITDKLIDCYNPVNSPILTADTGWDLYKWYEVSTGLEILAFSSFDNTFIPTEGGNYIVKATADGTLCPAISTTPIIIPKDICLLDYGDLPDNSSGTGINDYETSQENNGPSHVITGDLFLGSMVDAETNGTPSVDALGDGADEDGVTIFPTLNLSPEVNFQLPLSVSNTSGETAYLEVWIDWDGDGDFDGPNEKVADLDDSSSSFPSTLGLSVPADATTGSLLGVRIRLSNEDGLSPYGPANSGEIEDYLIGIECEQICLPFNIEINKDK